MNNCRCGMRQNMRQNMSERRDYVSSAQQVFGSGKPAGGDDFTPVMAYVPWQDWGEQFGEMEALCHGTLFPALVKPFSGGRN